MRAALALVVVAAARCGTDPGLPPGPADLPATAQGMLAFVDVTVVSMVGPRRPHQTVVTDSGRVVRIGPAATTVVPTGATVLPVPAGSYLTPGLADMHTHIFDRDELLLYLANGVTTVRNLHGLARHLAWRDSLEQGWMVGPRLLTAGPILDGDPPTRSTNTVLRTETEAAAEVAAEAARGFDYIKIYDNLPVTLYRAIGMAAKAAGIPVTGHLPTPVGLAGLFEDQVQGEVQHLEEFLPFLDDGRNAGLLDSIARGLARSGIAVVPTLTVFTSALDQSERLGSLKARLEVRYVNPETAATWAWEATGARRSGNAGETARYRRTVTFFEHQMVPALRRAGVTIVAGTDAPIPMIVPGFSLHDELANLVASGLSPLEALETATAAAARVLPARRPIPGFGTIRVGAPADLLVVPTDPSLSLAGLRNHLGVVARGRWYSHARLQLSLDSLAAGYRSR